ncbi:YfhO family protein [Panacibacter sp. DH6]|uniref:YfhO family protein n=1 Tax=Panacibacter microcysteis TaxID=2793269 RepID=A0A931GV66_9BACT|nr:YfhO family protein [Panacibacter microcysteis]MBG9377471.1 YfhO family protein [Panacibacter microcysteis]
MKNINWQKIYPHIIAIVIFLVVAALYCKPALQGKVMQQHDLAQWVGMSKGMIDYTDSVGHAPLWTNSMFSGMPGYMIAGYSNNIVPGYFIIILSAGLPQPLDFFFLACICFYFLALVLGIRPWIGIIGALMYAYATYNPIIITVGHVTKMYSIALMPGFIGSLLLLINRKYLWGTALTALFTSALVVENHYQIVYYAIIIAAFMAVAFIIKTIREKDYKHLAIVTVTVLLAAGIGIATNAVMMLPNYEYSKETIRGGSQLGVSGDTASKGTSGLNEDYAFSYSFAISEPFVMMVPRMFGGSSGRPEVEQDKSKAIAALQSMPQELGQQLARNMSYYWGGIESVGTAGPPYVGVIVCFLAIVGFVIVDRKYRWWILACCILTIIMSWGGYFKDVNRLFLEYLPMYNKFRAPSMIIVVPTLLLGMMAVLALEKIMSTSNLSALVQPYKKALLINGGIFVLLIMLYISFDYLTNNDRDLLKQVSSMDDQIKTPVKEFFTGLQEDRKGLFLGDLLRSLFFIIIAAVTLWLYIKNKLKPAIVLTLIGVFSFIDVIAIDTKYMNADDFEAKEDYDSQFVPTAADNQILQDKSFYRVLDLRRGISSAFNSGAITAYFHKTIGGYHPAKLSIYQDLIDSQLYKFPNCLPVINMLNTKYVITQNDQAQQNPGALGNAWFVKSVQFEPDAKAVMKALDTFEPQTVAIAEKSVGNVLKNPGVFDSAATITLLANHNDTVTYKAKTSSEQLAVFSEVYYDKGWNAYIDGKPAPYAKANYVLRAMMIPAGEHTIEYRFEPASHKTGWTITSVTSVIVVVLTLLAVFFEVRRKRNIAK